MFPPVEGYVGARNNLPVERLNFNLLGGVEIPTKYEQVGRCFGEISR